MKKLSDSKLFQEFLKNPTLESNLKEVDLMRDKIDIKLIEEPLRIIEKKLNYPTKGRILQLIAENKINIIYNTLNKIPRYLSNFGKVQQGQVVFITDITKYSVKRVNSNIIEIFPKTLYGLLQGGLVSYELANNWKKYTTNMTIIKNSSISYSKLFCKILDKNFAINIQPVKADNLAFFTAKFFLINHCGRIDNDTVDNLAYNACFNSTKLSVIKEFENMLDEDMYDDIIKFFDNLKKLEGLEQISIRSFIEQYARMYGETTILALDYLPAFLSMIFSSCVVANISKDFTIENVCGKFSSKAFLEFSKLLR